MSNESAAIKTAAIINMLAGFWLFASSWVFHASSSSAWNNRIVGAMIVAFAATRIAHPLITRGASVINLLFGAWMVGSPWLLRFTGIEGPFVNSLCVGALVLIVSAIGSSMGHLESPGGPPPVRP